MLEETEGLVGAQPRNHVNEVNACGNNACVNVVGLDEPDEISASEDDELEISTRQVRSTPVLPTKSEVEMHDDTGHVQYRSWCSACRRGRGRASPHTQVSESEKEEEQIPTISIDYGFFNKKSELALAQNSTQRQAASSSEGRSLPVLIAKDRRSKAVWSVPVPCKGVEHPYPGKKLLEVLDTTGYKRVIMKSDNEPSIVALVKSVKDGWRGELMPEHPPRGESHAPSNGEVERAVQSVQGLARTLKDHLEQKSGVVLGDTHPLLAWLVEYAGSVLTIYHKGAPRDGHTAWTRLRGKPWKHHLPQFGEYVEFRQKTRNKLQNKYRPGIFLGVKLDSTEKIVADAVGVYLVSDIQRVPEEQKWNAEMLKSIRSTPWEPSTSDKEGTSDVARSATQDLPEPIVLEPVNPEVEPVPVTVHEPKDLVRKLQIRKATLEAHGYTAGCPACDAQKMGANLGGKYHTPQCRKRLEKAMAEDPATRARSQEATKRQTEWLARELERQQKKSRQDNGPTEAPGAPCGPV